jgi:ubiquinone/menaquinone biosynthesis C-methylase UbiE
MLTLLSNVLSFSLGTLLGSQTVLRTVCATQPFPMPHQFSALLEHPLRLQYRNVSETLAEMGFQAGMTVLDLGCGSGLFTVEMARMVGATGKVFAVDLQQPLLAAAKQRAAAAGVEDRIRFYQAGATALPMDDQSVDLAVMIATFGEIDDKLEALAELKRVLKAGARLAISEELPDPAYLPPPLVRQQLLEAGFQPIHRTGNWFCYTLTWMAG